MASNLNTQPSASAMNVALCRAIAAHDPRQEIRGPDHLAEVFLEKPARASLYDPATHTLIRKKLEAVSPGGYEFFLARTAYLDGVVEQALRDQIPQIVLLGAGYDTRACRFSALLGETRFFELDSPATLQHKRSLLEAAQTAEPPQLSYVPVDFTRDDLATTLAAAGYRADRRTLFVWEGVTYYLPAQAVEDVLRFVRSQSPAGSLLCFDYMLPAASLEGHYGAQQSRAAMQAMYTAEPLGFDLDPDLAVNFLAERGFTVIEQLLAPQMERRYLTLADGSLAGRVLDLFCIVQAAVN